MGPGQEEARQICVEFLRAGPGAIFPSWGYDLNPQDAERVEKLVAALQAAQERVQELSIAAETWRRSAVFAREREKRYLETLARLRAHGEFVHDHVVMGLVAQHTEEPRKVRDDSDPAEEVFPMHSIYHPSSCLIHSGANCTCGVEVGE